MSVEDRVAKIEKKIDELVRGQVAMQQDMKLMAKTLDKLADVGLNQVRLEGMVLENKKDIDIAFGEIRKIRENGVDQCGAHLERTKALEREVATIKAKAWQIWALIIGQLVQFYFLATLMRGLR